MPGICHITDSFYPEQGGVERVVENLALEQVARGHVVTVMSKQVEGRPARERYRGIEVYRYPKAMRPTPWVYVTSWSGSAKTFRRICREQPVAVVHCHLTLSAQGALCVAKEKRLPVLASFYGPWHKEFEAEIETLRRARGALYGLYLDGQSLAQRRMQSRLLRMADRVVALSDHSEHEATALYPGLAEKYRKVPGGVETARFASGRPQYDLRKQFGIGKDRFVVFSLRRLIYRMGLDLLLEAVARLVAQKRKLVLVIGGRGPQRQELETLAAQLNISDCVRFAGFIADDNLPDAYRSADLVVVPTRAEENFGLPVLEAAACGTPVITTPSGSLAEVTGGIDPALLTDGISVDALVEKIAWAMDHADQLCREFASHSKAIAQRYSWSRIADEIEREYRTMGGAGEWGRDR